MVQIQDPYSLKYSNIVILNPKIAGPPLDNNLHEFLVLGLRDALFLLAKARYLAGDIKASVSTLQHLIDNLDPTMAEGWWTPT